jgi:hypothetical protein
VKTLIEEPLCFRMITSDRVHNNLTLCFRDHNKEYNYLFINDMYNITGFGLVDSIMNYSAIQEINMIMAKYNQEPVMINMTTCLLQ